MTRKPSGVVCAALGAGMLAWLWAGQTAAGADGAAAAPASQATLERLDTPSPSTTFTGISGLIRVPNADVMPAGDLRYTLNPATPGPLSPMPGGDSHDALTLGMAPNTEIAISRSLYLTNLGHDYLVHGKYKVLQETANRPSVAVGVLDLERNGPPTPPSYFAVASKHFLTNRVEATLGLTEGEAHGVEAGVSYRPISWLDLQGEYDTRHFNYGAGLALGDRFFARVAKVDVGTAYTLAYQFPLAYPGVPAPPTPQAPLGPPAQPAAAASTDLIQQELARLGLENVQAQIQPVNGLRTMMVEFDNREYTLDDYDAVLAALPVVARLADADVQQAAVRVEKRGLVVAEVLSPLDDYRRFARGEITAQQFAPKVTVQRLPAVHPAEMVTSPTDVANKPWGRLDLTLAPDLMTQVTTRTAVTRYGWSLEPGAQCLLMKGVQADFRWQFPFAGSLDKGHDDRVITDEALVTIAAPLAHRVMVQGLGGRFSDHTFQHWDGFGGEAAMTAGPEGLLHLTVAQLQNDQLGTNIYALGEYWQEIPSWNLQVRAFGGRFLYQDEGGGVDLIRYSREVELTFDLRRAGGSTRMGVGVSFPLSPRRQDQVPTHVRLRPADRFDCGAMVLSGATNLDLVASQKAEELTIGPNLVDAFFNRDRLSTAGFAHYLRGEH